MAANPGRRKDPEGWLMRIRTIGPGKVPPQATHRPGRKGDDRPHRPADKRLIGAVLTEENRKQVAKALRSILDTYPFGLLAASVGAQDLDLVLKCPTTDLTLIADLVTRRLMPTLKEAGFGNRFWRKGFLRRALGTSGDVRRALVQLRSEARVKGNTLIDRVQQDDQFGVRRRRGSTPAQQTPAKEGAPPRTPRPSQPIE